MTTTTITSIPIITNCIRPTMSNILTNCNNNSNKYKRINMNRIMIAMQRYNSNTHQRIATTIMTTSSFSTNTRSHHHEKELVQVQGIQKRTFTSLNQSTPYNICFLRHGQSTWNRDNRFIGWTDTPLTDQGVLEARVAGQMLHNSHIQFDEVHTSLLRRSIRTTNIVLMEMAQEYIPVYKHWRLNERNYGALTGLNKKECVAEHGVDQVKRWRRSYDEPPPPMPLNHPYNPINDPRYRNMLHKIPKSESLKCTVQRSSVYWDTVLAPALRLGKTILVVGHENNLRSLIMRLENIDPQDVIHLSLPRAVPLAYKLDLNTLQPINVRTDGSLDSATGFLRGEWLGGDDSVTEILHRDHQQVYDISITNNLEIGSTSNDTTVTTQYKQVIDTLPEIPPGAKALGNETAGSFLGTAPVITSSLYDPISQHNGTNVGVVGTTAAIVPTSPQTPIDVTTIPPISSSGSASTTSSRSSSNLNSNSNNNMNNNNTTASNQQQKQTAVL